MDTSATNQLKRNSAIPFIVDDRFDVLHEEFLGDIYDRHDGLLAVPTASKQSLPMSGYGKTQYAEGKEFGNTRTMDGPVYIYAQQGATQASIQEPVPSYAKSNPISYGAGSLFQESASVEDLPNNYTSPRSRNIPQITRWDPKKGPAGVQISIFLLSAFEFDPTWTFYATFGQRRSQCDLTRLGERDSYFDYLISLDVPQFAATAWQSTYVPISLHAEDNMGNIMPGPSVGSFTYSDVVQQTALQGSPEMSRKRKISADAVSSESVSKRASSQQNQEILFTRQPNLTDDSPLGPQITPAYRNSQGQQSKQLGDHQRQANRQNSANSTAPGQTVRRTTPNTPLMNQVPAPHPTRSPNIPQNALNHTYVGSTSPSIANPTLVRTSSLQQSPSPSSTPTGVSSSAQFNPYAMYPHKASLKIKGNLDDMTTNWTAEEQGIQRRLVQFYRSQEGSTIHATFKAVTPEERQPNTICISCIWWEAKGECYVTSVDTIALLESLIAVRFTVEEKNRIRRNLEGFRPLTVSKGKADSEDFFKLIMGFPNPKPRNIEKDVKAFPWKTLDHALKKIISKYSASYSSTAGTLSTPVATNYRTGYNPDIRQEAFHSHSPYDMPDSGMSTPYSHAISLPNNNLSAVQANNRVHVPFTADGSIALHSTHTPDYPLYQYPTTSHMGASASLIPVMATQQQAQATAQQRSSWDFGGYIEHPASTVGGSTLYALPAGQEVGPYGITHTSPEN